MARFKIISKDGASIRYEGKPRYIGTYLKPSHLEFNEIASPTPIDWEVGDYVDYPRTGLRYRLYSIPQATKNARRGTHGKAFVYPNVQLHAATKELEIALFRDLVENDNNIHFSTSPDVATFENVEGIARRIQACMNDLYPNRWEIRIAAFDSVEDADIIAKISEAKDFALSNGTCLDALSKIYELWEDIGWIHSYDATTGKDIITIGYANKRISENASPEFFYGKGNGLTAIKKTQTNRDEFATRLYVYGSGRNLPSRYYNGLNILNAESVDIRNLMLPLDKWGKTDGLPDARKAYIENADAVAKFGVIPKMHYFDTEDSGADIYPSVKRMTIGRVRAILSELNQTAYYPSTSIYPDANERVDQILLGSSVEDDGQMRPKGQAYEVVQNAEITFGNQNFSIPANSTEPVTSPIIGLADVELETNKKGEVTVKPKGMNFILLAENVSQVQAKFVLATRYSTIEKRVDAIKSETNEYAWSFSLPQMKIERTKDTYSFIPVVLTMAVTVVPNAGSKRNANLVMPDASMEIGFNRILAKTFDISLKQLGFDINERAAAGEGKTIALNTGMCAGREFEISNCIYSAETDSWTLTCKRQQDDTLGILFPNSAYQIAKDDVFVLTDIAMPELYIRAAMEDVYEEGMKLLAKASRIQNHYEPSIDAKVMIESGRILREGMFMEISDEDIVDNATDYILIDTLSIYEDESAIPTYKVTLKERRKVTYKGTPSATSTTSTKSVEDSTVEVDLSGYATEGFVNDADAKISARVKEIESWFYKLDENTLGTPFHLFSEKEVSASGVGEEGQGGSGGGEGSSITLLEDWLKYNASIAQALGANLGVELNTRLTALENGGVDPDLSAYATKTYVNQSIQNLVGAAPANLDTLYEIATVLQSNVNSIDDILTAISKKADKSELTSLQTQINANIASIAELRGLYNTLLTHINSEISRVEGKVNKANNDISALNTSVSDLDSKYANEVTKLKAEDTNIKGNISIIQNSLSGYADSITRIDNKVKELDTTTEGLTGSIANINSTTQGLSKSVGELNTSVNNLSSRLNKLEGFWQEDGDGNIWTDKTVYSTKDISAGEVGVSAFSRQANEEPSNGVLSLPVYNFTSATSVTDEQMNSFGLTEDIIDRIFEGEFRCVRSVINNVVEIWGITAYTNGTKTTIYLQLGNISHITLEHTSANGNWNINYSN